MACPVSPGRFRENFLRFNGQPIYAELSPVTDFREARCRQHEVTTCCKGGFCNFMHLKAISPELGERLFGRRGRRADDAGHYPSSRHRSGYRDRSPRDRRRDDWRDRGGRYDRY